MAFDSDRPFCWTKMQAESGQSLSEILRRKELERSAGKGVFFWGVGNSLGDKREALLSGEVRDIAFSKMLSRPKRIDTDPGRVAIWKQYKDIYGCIKPIPDHVLLLSRAYSGGKIKKHHYALVCYSNEVLALGNHGSIDIATYKNYGSTNPRIGSSQVTTVVEPHPVTHATTDERIYQINMLCTTVAPFFVRLVNPLLISEHSASKLFSTIAGSADSRDYEAKLALFIREIRSNPNHVWC